MPVTGFELVSQALYRWHTRRATPYMQRLMGDRLKRFADKGCTAVEADNLGMHGLANEEDHFSRHEDEPKRHWLCRLLR